MRQDRGIAIATALAISTILVIFAAALLSFLANDYHASRTRQRAVQAEWNARSGLEHYLATGKLPKEDPKSKLREIVLSEKNKDESCQVRHNPETGDIEFVGVSHGTMRVILLVGGDPNRLVLKNS